LGPAADLAQELKERLALRPWTEASTIPRAGAEPDPAPSGDLHQSLRPGRVQLSDEHLRLPSHRPPPATVSADHPDPVKTPTFSDEALAALKIQARRRHGDDTTHQVALN
jgi:hypothetical protein